LSEAKSHERTPSLVKQRKGKDEMSVGSPAKTSIAPKKHKRNEQVLEPIVELAKHINFHFSSKLNGDVHSLIIPLNGPKRGKGGK
jgi:hypothetical protein